MVLAQKLLAAEDVNYLLSETFSQDCLEAYFSRQRHEGHGCDNPGVQQIHSTISTTERSISRPQDNQCTENKRYDSACDTPF